MSGLTQHQKAHFIQHGYLIIRQAIPQSLLEPALCYVDQKYASQQGQFLDRDRQHESILALFAQSQLKNIAHDLLGDQNISLLGAPQIAFTPCSQHAVDIGMTLQSDHPSNKWHVDASKGKYAALGADFLLLVGVALSDGQQIDENRGQFVYFPGSHFATHLRLKQLIQTKNPGEIMQTFRTSKPSVGLPKRALLNPGDAIIAHQRLAHCAGFNLSEILRKNVYFRVTHRNFENLVEQYVSNDEPWIGFQGLYDVLEIDAGVEQLEDEEGNSQAKDERNKRLLSVRSIGLPKPVIENYLINRFIKDGYFIMPNFIQTHILNKAKQKLHKVLRFNRFSVNHNRFAGAGAGNGKGVIELKRPVRLHNEFMNVLLLSGMVDILESLLGEQNVVVANSISDVFQVPPLNRLEDNDNDNDGQEDASVSQSRPLPTSTSWMVDTGKGRFKARGFDHLVRIGTTLSDGLDADENCGQFLVWPGSHLKTHEMIRTIMQENDGCPTGRPFWQARKRLDLGSPKRLLLNEGDVFVMHQRLATAIAPNASQHSSTFVQFFVETVNMDALFDDFNYAGMPFTGFEGLSSDRIFEATSEI